MTPHADLLPYPFEPRRTPEPPPEVPPELDDSWPLEIDDDAWDALVPEDDYEPLPEYGDFWTAQDAA